MKLLIIEPKDPNSIDVILLPVPIGPLDMLQIADVIGYAEQDFKILAEELILSPHLSNELENLGFYRQYVG
jgi:hypothetical protein